MLRRFICILSAAAVIACTRPLEIHAQEIIPKEEVIEVIPETGEHPSPVIAGMILAFSGVFLFVLIDERNR